MSDPRRAPVVDVLELRRRTGLTRSVRRNVELEGLETSAAVVDDGRLALDLVVESVVEGLVVHGRIAGTWTGACRRCVEPVTGPLTVDVREVYERDPTEGETWPIVDERIDLGPMVREAAMLALPLAPLCADDCAGPDPERFPTGTVDTGEPDGDRGGDPRWAALDALRTDE